jgi:hypothetical protein
VTQTGTSGNNFVAKFIAPERITTVDHIDTDLWFVAVLEYSQDAGAHWTACNLGSDNIIMYNSTVGEYSKIWNGVTGPVAGNSLRITLYMVARVAVDLYTQVTPTVVMASGANANLLTGISASSTSTVVSNLPIITFGPLTENPVQLTINTNTAISGSHYDVVSYVVVIIVYGPKTSTSAEYVFDASPITYVNVSGFSPDFQYDTAASTAVSKQIFTLQVHQPSETNRQIIGIIVCVQLANGTSGWSYSPIGDAWPRILHTDIAV